MRSLLLCLSLLATTSVWALPTPKAKTKLVVDKSRSTVTYTMKHPVHTWDGVSREVNGALLYDTDTKKVENLAMVIKVASFDSKNANRDSHALEVLEALKYPNVTFTAQDIRPNADGTLAVNGKLTFHGVTRPVSVNVTQKESGKALQFEGSFPVSLSDYKIEKPSLMMVPVEEVMTISFRLSFPVP